MLIAVPANAVRFFRLVAGSLRPEHILITERAGLVERQRGAGLVSSNRKNANGSTVGGAIPRNQLTAGGVQHQRGHCRRFRTQSAGRGCGMSRVTVALRLVMGKGFFARHKHPLHWCVQQIVNGIRCGLPAASGAGAPCIRRSSAVSLRACALCGAAARMRRAVFTVIPGVSASTRACSSRP